MSGPPNYHWSAPAPPPGARPPQRIRGGRVAAGIGAALGAHLLTAAPILVAVVTDNGDFGGDVGIGILLIGQVVVFLGCMIVGIVLTVRQEPGFGVGLLVGWAIGVVVAPVIGFGACILVLNRMGS